LRLSRSGVMPYAIDPEAADRLWVLSEELRCPGRGRLTVSCTPFARLQRKPVDSVEEPPTVV
jgi:hypothetical protein